MHERWLPRIQEPPMATPDILDDYESACACELARAKRRFPAQDILAAP